MDNRELDAQVAELMGWIKNPPNVRGIGWLTDDGRMSGKPLPYSTDIKAAFMVVDKLVEMGYYVDIGIDEYGAQVQLDRYEDHWKLNNVESTRADTLPEAICLAALKAVDNNNQTNKE